MSTKTDTSMLSVTEAAAKIGVDARTLRAAINEGQVLAHRIGKRLLIPARTIEKLIEAE